MNNIEGTFNYFGTPVSHSVLSIALTVILVISIIAFILSIIAMSKPSLSDVEDKINTASVFNYAGSNNDYVIGSSLQYVKDFDVVQQQTQTVLDDLIADYTKA